jgi:hypothetical protein
VHSDIHNLHDEPVVQRLNTETVEQLRRAAELVNEGAKPLHHAMLLTQ